MEPILPRTPVPQLLATGPLVAASLGSLLALLLGCGGAEDSRGDDGGLRIYLARHGQTSWNAERRLQGWTDVPLNAKGREQAAQLAARLSGTRLDRVYSSALVRSRETALAFDGRAPIESLAGLNEQRLGKFEGAYLDGRDPDMAAEFERRSADFDDPLDGGESTRQHFARVKGTVDQILRRHPAGRILIVGHGGTNALILAALLDLPLEETDRFHQSNDEVYAIELVRGHRPSIWKLVPPEELEAL